MTCGPPSPAQVAAKKARDIALAKSILASPPPAAEWKRTALKVWGDSLAAAYAKAGITPPPPPGVPVPPSVAALRLADAILTLPRKIVQAVQGYNFKLGKRPADHPSNLRHGRMLAIPTVAVFVRDALTQHASVSAFDFLGLREKSITTAELRALGFVVPKGRERFRWMVFHDAAERVIYADVHTILSTLGIDCPHPEQDTIPWLPFFPDHLPAPGGKHASVCCPLHEDTKASACIFPPSPRGYGAGVCHACTGPDGAPTRFCWRELPDGTIGARRARQDGGGFGSWTREEGRKNAGRYNGGPPVVSAAVSHLYGTTLGVSLRTIDRSMTLSGYGRGLWTTVASNSPLRGDVFAVIARSERNADYGNIRPKIADHEFESAARMAADPTRPNNVDARDRLIRVQPQFSTYIESLPWGDVPGGWKDIGVANVLLDIDGLRLGDDAAARRWAAEVLGIVARDPRCSGRVTVVRTSAGGAQVLVELARPIAGRIPGEAWWGTDGARSWYRTLGDRMIAAAHAEGAEGGAIDWSAFAPCRLARRPGWRVTRDGTTYRAHLLAAVVEVPASTVTLAA